MEGPSRLKTYFKRGSPPEASFRSMESVNVGLGGKLHLALDELIGEILAVVVSTNDWGDSEILPDWVEQLRETSTKFRVMEPMTPSQSAERGQSSRPITMP
jgi:hypothetical protein